jgi:two-component system NarL family sensor kinase
MHSRGFAAAVRESRAVVHRSLIDAQSTFLLEVLSPFEMAQRSVGDANASLRKLNDVLEAQAKRIANALHSEAGQLLASVHFALADAGRDLPEANTQRLANVRTLLVEIENRLRNLSHQLRPTVLDDLGLAAALDLLGESAAQRCGLQVEVHVSLKGDLRASIETALYRIIQEALTNAAKHADANRVDVEVRQVEHRIVCSVRDDGVGFDSTAALRRQRPGLGLTEIRESVAALGGMVRVSMNGDHGTDLTIEIPLDA